MCGPPVPAAAPVHGAVGQQDLSSLPTAATALRAHCSPTVPRPLRLCFESHQCPRSPHASAARLHTCSPRRAPSPSLVMTPCDSEYGLDHRTRAGIARQVPASARIRSEKGWGRGHAVGAGLALGRGPGGAGRPAGLSRHLVVGQCVLGTVLVLVSSEYRRSPHSFREVALSSEPGCPRKGPALMGWAATAGKMPAPTTSDPPGVRCGSARGAEARFWPPAGEVGGAGERPGVGASGKEEKEEAPKSCFRLSLRLSAPLPFTTSIFFRAS